MVRFSSRDPGARLPSWYDSEASLLLRWTSIIDAARLVRRRLLPEQRLDVSSDEISVDGSRRTTRRVEPRDVVGLVGFDHHTSTAPGLALRDGTTADLPTRLFPEQLGPFSTPYTQRRYDEIGRAIRSVLDD